MKILERYIGLTLIKAVLLILLIFVGLEIFILLATQFGALGKGSYTIWQAFIYVLLILPQQTYQLFPMAGLLGMLFGMSLLANHSELIIMRCSGVSPAQIMRAALKTGIIIVIAMTIIGELLAPAAKLLADKRKVVATSSSQAIKTSQGLWLRQGKNFYHIKTVYSTQHIANISRYEFNDQQQLISASYAADGYYQHNNWYIYNIKQSQINQNQITTQFIPTIVWYLAINPNLLHISQITPEEMSLHELSDFIHYQQSTHLTTENFKIIFWQRALQPLACLVMMFLAVPFIFGPLRSVNTSYRMVLGVCVGFIFYLLNQLFPPLSQVLNIPPFLAVLAPIILFALTGYILLRRVR